MKYWYHFAIMFEAVFILTAVDAGTRIGRFMLQEMFGKVISKFNDTKWVPGIIITGVLFSFAWGYLVYTGNISTIWPLFGMSNQLLASSALIIVTTMLIRMGKAGYAWVTAAPGIFFGLRHDVCGLSEHHHHVSATGDVFAGDPSHDRHGNDDHSNGRSLQTME
jgi:carbon starvation protein